MVAGVNRVTHAPHGGKNGWKAALEIAINESISNGSDFRFLVVWFMPTGAETFFYRNDNSSLHSTYRCLEFQQQPSTSTGKKTPGGAGTHTGHTGHTRARAHAGTRLPVPWFFKIED